MLYIHIYVEREREREISDLRSSKFPGAGPVFPDLNFELTVARSVFKRLCFK